MLRRASPVSSQPRERTSQHLHSAVGGEGLPQDRSVQRQLVSHHTAKTE